MSKNTLAHCQQELAEVSEKWKRAVSDYQNLERRVTEQNAEIIRISRIQTIAHFLPLIDHLRKAAETKDEGIISIFREAQKMLHDFGVSILDETGVAFDPTKHEALELVPGTEDGLVIEILNPGYLMGDTLIRPAQVKVSKKTN